MFREIALKYSISLKMNIYVESTLFEYLIFNIRMFY